MDNIKLSLIVPVYNRPDEVEDLLQSLDKQDDKDVEIIIVEDGSTVPCEDIIKQYSNKLNLQYHYKINEKPAIARNYGMNKATGNYFLFVDSDCILPPQYISTVKKELTNNYVDAFGGPDKADTSFSTVQKAINFAMTSFLTTGGIRGGGEKIDKFYPRSFNLGFSRQVFENLGGFPVIKMHPGEDMVLAIEIIKQGFKTRLIKHAYVYHKRRATLTQFYKQVFRFAKTRVIISKVYPQTFKIFYAFPSLFVLGTFLLIILSVLSGWFLAPLVLYVLAIFSYSLLLNKSLTVAAASIISSFYQLFGYGFGFLKTAFQVFILRKDEYGVLKNGFYSK